MIGQYPIDARQSDTEPAGDIRGSDALQLEADDLSSMLTSGLPTAFVATLMLGFGDARLLALQHGFPLSLLHGADHAQHQPADRGARVEALQTPERDHLASTRTTITD